MNSFYKIFMAMGIGLFLIGSPVLALAVAAPTATTTPNQVSSHILDGNVVRVGGVIQIDDAVKGDVIAVGSSITINGPVAGDVIAAGSVVRINGAVSGSVRVVGNSVEISGEVDHNVWAFGNSINIAKESMVGWDVYATGATVEINGAVNGNISASGSTVVIGNAVGKDVKASLNTSGQLVLQKTASIAGNVSYAAADDKQLVKNDGAQITGTVVRRVGANTSENFRGALMATFIFFRIISFFGLLVLGLVLVTLFPKFLLQVNDEMMRQPTQSIGWGILYLVVVPIVAILLMITIIGLPLGLMIIPFYIMGFYVAKVIVGFALGLMLINNMVSDKKFKGSLIWPLVIGLIIIVFLASLPLIGHVITFLLVLWGVGALVKVKKTILAEYR